jgi:penicillin-binding protein 1C
VSGGRRIGGSTITMQLARRLYDIDSRRATLGQVKQIVAALWLEARYGKDEILEAYLNLVPFGGNVEGIGAASLVHFGKAPARLSLPEALSLALIAAKPEPARAGAARGRARVRALREALGRRLLALWPAAGDASRAQPGRRRRASDDLPFLAPHFTDQMLAPIRPGRLSTQ